MPPTAQASSCSLHWRSGLSPFLPAAAESRGQMASGTSHAQMVVPNCCPIQSQACKRPRRMPFECLHCLQGCSGGAQQGGHEVSRLRNVACEEDEASACRWSPRSSAPVPTGSRDPLPTQRPGRSRADERERRQKVRETKRGEQKAGDGEGRSEGERASSPERARSRLWQLLLHTHAPAPPLRCRQVRFRAA